MKTCTKCKQSKDLDQFYKSGKYLKSRCIECEIKHTSAYQKQNREAATAYVRKWRFTNVYGITQEQYNQLFLKQEGKCAICSKHRDELDRDLCVDHDHKTDKVRGLLCYPCNVALGYMKDSVAALLSAAKYLEVANASPIN